MQPVPFVGQAYQLTNIDIEYQRCINLMPILDPTDRSNQALIMTEGHEKVFNTGLSEIRAMIVYNSRIFAVADNEFIELFYEPISKSMYSVFIDFLDTSEGIVHFALNDTQIMLVDGNTYYIYDATTEDFIVNADPDFTGAETVVNIDGYFFYNEPNSSVIWATDLLDGTTISALDFVNANNQPDKVVALTTVFGELWALGETTIQVYSNTAEATGFPFTPRTGATMYKGCLAKNSVVNMENTIVFLCSDYDVVMANGYNLVPLTNKAIRSAISKYTVKEDAIAYTYEKGLGKFYVLIFPTEEKCWVFDFNSRMWHERAFYNNGYERPLSQVAADYKGSILVGGYETGRIYLLNDEYYTDDGIDVIRKRTFPHINVQNELIEVNETELIADTSYGTSNVILRYSVDRGHTWSSDLTYSVTGNNAEPIRWNRLGTARNFLFEIEYSSDRKIAFKDFLVG